MRSITAIEAPTGFRFGIRVAGVAIMGALLLAWSAPVRAQEWNSPAVSRLVARAIQQRAASVDGGLRDYQARAHGFVFFFGQLGEGLAGPPSLIKSDQLELEVYWTAAGGRKQRIIGWRDRSDLPTDIQYHRDHLGIVMDNFGDRIGLGHNDEVNDVPHPLSRAGPEIYDYAIRDSLTIRLPGRDVRVFEIQTRPKSLDDAGIVGSLFIDIETSALVRFRFTFTRTAYVDPTLEDITVHLENALWDGTYWLPRHQETEIRRRSSWLDLPARGIIRSRWTIDDYRFNVGTPAGVFVGSEIVALPAAARDAFPWDQSLDDAIEEITGPLGAVDLDAVRSDVRRLASDRLLTGLPARRVGAASLSDLLHFNRVEGLAPGVGLTVRPGEGNAAVELWGSYGVADERFKARVTGRVRADETTFAVQLAREIRDIGDEPVIAPLLNSFVAQESGHDFGDYVLVTSAELEVRGELRNRVIGWVKTAVQEIMSVEVRASPVTGSFRPNAALGDGTFGALKVGVTRRPSGLVAGGGWDGTLEFEAGTGAGTRYVRVRGAGQTRVDIGRTDLVLRGWGGWGSAELPRHRSFVLGGRASLVSEPFRAWGGRYGAFGSLEWRVPVRTPDFALGPLVTTDRIVLAPFVAAGWMRGALRDPVPWTATNGVRGVVGVGVEWLYGLFRTDFAISVRNPRVGVVFDIRRDLWGVL